MDRELLQQLRDTTDVRWGELDFWEPVSDTLLPDACALEIETIALTHFGGVVGVASQPFGAVRAGDVVCIPGADEGRILAPSLLGLLWRDVLEALSECLVDDVADFAASARWLERNHPSKEWLQLSKTVLERAPVTRRETVVRMVAEHEIEEVVRANWGPRFVESFRWWVEPELGEPSSG